LIVAGSFFLGLGLIGTVFPVLPTTPFLLLTAACYLRSSKKCYNWIINNKVFGSYIRNYLEGNGIPIRTKIFTIVFLWASILLSIIFAVRIIWVRILLFIIAIGVTIHIAQIRTYSPQKESLY